MDVCVCVCVCVLEMVEADGGGRIVTALAYDVALLSTSANPYVSARATHVTRMTATTMRPPVALVLVLLLAALGPLCEGASLGCPATAVPDTPEQIARQKELSAQFLGHYPGDPFIPLDAKFDALAAQVGIAGDVLRYFLGCLFCYVLALVHAWLPDDPSLKHFYSFFWGFTISWACFGVNTFIPLISSLFVLCICKLMGSSKYTPPVVFFVAMGVTSACHIYRLYIDYGGYTLDVSGPQMIITIKLTQFAWNVYDHGKDAGKYTHRVANAVDIGQVSFLQFLSFIFFFGGYLGGPAYEFQDYMRFTNGEMFKDEPNKQKPGLLARIVPAGVSFAISISALLINLTVAKQFNAFALLCDEFAAEPFYRQVGILWLTVALTRSKYYCIWNLAEGGMILSGFGYNGRDKKTNTILWDRCNNAKILSVEFGESIRESITEWNKKTSLWLRVYAYERMMEFHFPQWIAMYGTMAVSAFWHGFYSGYYITFGFGAWLQSVGKSMRAVLRPYFEDYATGKTPFWYNMAGRVITGIMLNFVTVSFMVVTIENCLTIWKRVGYFGLVVGFTVQAGLILWKMTPMFKAKNQVYRDAVAARKAKKSQ